MAPCWVAFCDDLLVNKTWDSEAVGDRYTPRRRANRFGSVPFIKCVSSAKGLKCFTKDRHGRMRRRSWSPQPRKPWDPSTSTKVTGVSRRAPSTSQPFFADVTAVGEPHSRLTVPNPCQAHILDHLRCNCRACMQFICEWRDAIKDEFVRGAHGARSASARKGRRWVPKFKGVRRGQSEERGGEIWSRKSRSMSRSPTRPQCAPAKGRRFSPQISWWFGNYDPEGDEWVGSAKNGRQGWKAWRRQNLSEEEDGFRNVALDGTLGESRIPDKLCGCAREDETLLVRPHPRKSRDAPRPRRETTNVDAEDTAHIEYHGGPGYDRNDAVGQSDGNQGYLDETEKRPSRQYYKERRGSRDKTSAKSPITQFTSSRCSGYQNDNLRPNEVNENEGMTSVPIATHSLVFNDSKGKGSYVSRYPTNVSDPAYDTFPNRRGQDNGKSTFYKKSRGNNSWNKSPNNFSKIYSDSESLILSLSEAQHVVDTKRRKAASLGRHAARFSLHHDSEKEACPNSICDAIDNREGSNDKTFKLYKSKRSNSKSRKRYKAGRRNYHLDKYQNGRVGEKSLYHNEPSTIQTDASRSKTYKNEVNRAFHERFGINENDSKAKCSKVKNRSTSRSSRKAKHTFNTQNNHDFREDNTDSKDSLYPSRCAIHEPGAKTDDEWLSKHVRLMVDCGREKHHTACQRMGRIVEKSKDLRRSLNGMAAGLSEMEGRMDRVKKLQREYLKRANEAIDFSKHKNDSFNQNTVQRRGHFYNPYRSTRRRSPSADDIYGSDYSSSYDYPYDRLVDVSKNCCLEEEIPKATIADYDDNLFDNVKRKEHDPYPKHSWNSFHKTLPKRNLSVDSFQRDNTNEYWRDWDYGEEHEEGLTPKIFGYSGILDKDSYSDGYQNFAKKVNFNTPSCSSEDAKSECSRIKDHSFSSNRIENNDSSNNNTRVLRDSRTECMTPSRKDFDCLNHSNRWVSHCQTTRPVVQNDKYYSALLEEKIPGRVLSDQEDGNSRLLPSLIPSAPVCSERTAPTRSNGHVNKSGTPQSLYPEDCNQNNDLVGRNDTVSSSGYETDLETDNGIDRLKNENRDTHSSHLNLQNARHDFNPDDNNKQNTCPLSSTGTMDRNYASSKRHSDIASDNSRYRIGQLFFNRISPSALTRRCMQNENSLYSYTPFIGWRQRSLLLGDCGATKRYLLEGGGAETGEEECQTLKKGKGGGESDAGGGRGGGGGEGGGGGRREQGEGGGRKRRGGGRQVERNLLKEDRLFCSGDRTFINSSPLCGEEIPCGKQEPKRNQLVSSKLSICTSSFLQTKISRILSDKAESNGKTIK